MDSAADLDAEPADVAVEVGCGFDSESDSGHISQVDPAGANGPPFLKAASSWFFAAAAILLLPRQWVSSVAAAMLGVCFHFAAAWANNKKKAPAASLAEKAPS